MQNSCRLCRYFNQQSAKCYRLSDIHKKEVVMTQQDVKLVDYVKECETERLFKPSIKTMMGYKDL